MQYVESHTENHTECPCHIGKRKKLSIHAKSTHAEEMAIDKLIKNIRKSRKYSRKIIDVSLMVIRMSAKGTPDCYRLGNSKPCSNCLHRINSLPKYGYRVTKIYYSDDDGTISVSNATDLENDETVRPSSFYRNTNIPTYLRKTNNRYICNIS